MSTPLPALLQEAAAAFRFRADRDPEHGSYFRRRAAEALQHAQTLAAGPPPPPPLTYFNETVMVHGKRHYACRMLRAARLAATVLAEGQADASAVGYATDGAARESLRRFANWIERATGDQLLADRVRSISVNSELLAFEGRQGHVSVR